MNLPTSIWLALVPFIQLVSSACSVTGINAAVPRSPTPTPENTLANLGDLRTPTPYTFTLTALANGCSTDPQTITDLVTWDVNGTSFVADNAATVTFSTASFVYATFTFSGMTVTSLTPGERLTLLDGSGAANVYSVPPTAIPYSSTASSVTSPTTTSTPTPTPSQANGSSTPTGGIIAGAVVGGIAVIAIIAFAIYKFKTHKRNTPPPAPIDFNSYDQPPAMQEYSSGYDPKHQSINAGYDPVSHESEPMSGNLRSEY